MQSSLKRWMLSIPAFLAGIVFFILHQKDENGRITPTDWIIAVITLIVAIGIVFAVNCWGTRKR
jgi:protein-S-isoprenylcysteine O-methyltransferase Ste14